MKKSTGPNGERVTRIRRSEVQPPSEERMAEIEAHRDEEIDTSDIPELSPEFWEEGVVEFREGTEPLSLRVNHFVLDYFKRGGKGYQRRMNDVLRSYVIHQMIKEAEARGRAASDISNKSKASAASGR